MVFIHKARKNQRRQNPALFSKTALTLVVSAILITLLIGPKKALLATPDSATTVDLSPKNEPRIFLLTVQPGKEFYSIWGHTALLVVDPKINHGHPMTFDYGLFRLDPVFLSRFLHGEPTYWLGVSPWKNTEEMFLEEQRAIYAQELLFTREKKENFLKLLYNDTLPANRFYSYHVFTNNCTTRVRDLINETLDGTLKQAYSETEDDATYRSLSTEYGRSSIPYFLLMQSVQNVRADQPITKYEAMFLPLLLQQGLTSYNKSLTENGHPAFLSRAAQLTPEGTEIPPETVHRNWRTFQVGLVVFLTIFFLWPVSYRNILTRMLNFTGVILWSLPAGIAGAVYLLLSSISPLENFHDNYNILFLNPFLLFLPLHRVVENRIPHRINLGIYGFFLLLPVVALVGAMTHIIHQDLIQGALFATTLHALLLWKYLQKRRPAE